MNDHTAKIRLLFVKMFLISFLFTISASEIVSAYPSYEKALPGTARNGANAIPTNGVVRIPVIVLGDDALPENLDEFFSNRLDAMTFRNYWRINSMNKYDPKTYVIRVDASGENFPSTTGSDRSQAASWKSYVADALKNLSESNAMDKDYLDSSGPGQLPDGWTDGMIVIAPGISEPIIALDNEKKDDAKPETGPFVILGSDSSTGKILSAFSSLMGFVKIESNLCNSISDESGGLYMVDGYNRARSGWVDVVNIEGPVKNILILPSSTSESIYRLGKGKEYFLIEGRAAAKGLDVPVGKPGIAVYHVDETSNMGNGATRTGAPVITNVVPAGVKKCEANSVLFRNNDASMSDYFNQNTSALGDLPTHMNWNSGEPSDAMIVNIDVESHFPIMTAAIGYK